MLAAGVALLPAPGAVAEPAASLLQHGQADQALAVLDRQLATNVSDAAALNLACRVYFSEGQWTAAQSGCERAVALRPADSNDHLWLGRVLGREAEHASPLSAFGLARQAHAEFETAYRLDRRNAAAVADLAEYYVDAPRLLGGGKDKALALADAASGWNQSLAHSIRAEAALDSKDYATGERELRAAAAAQDAQPETWVSLASFYRKQGRITDMLATLDRAIALDNAHDDALVSAAEQLTKSHQRPAQAIALLQEYLGSPNQSENAPTFKVHAMLASLLANAGDSRGAGEHLAQAHALASQWQPKHPRGIDS